MESPTLIIKEQDDWLVLYVQDYEVFDTVDDILTEEHDLIYSFRTDVVIDGIETYLMYFPKSVTRAKIELAISKIDKAELRRLWELSN